MARAGGHGSRPRSPGEAVRAGGASRLATVGGQTLRGAVAARENTGRMPNKALQVTGALSRWDLVQVAPAPAPERSRSAAEDD